MNVPVGSRLGTPGVWSAAAVVAIADRPWAAPPVLAAADCPLVLPDRWIWDLWPVQTLAGGVATVAGGELWMALAAPVMANPIDRHAVARLWLLHHSGGDWHDLGPVLPVGHSPGSREWSGSATLDGDRLVLHFTAAGRRGEAVPTFEQRLFMTETRLPAAAICCPIGWSPPIETVRSDGAIYDRARETTGAVGTIKAFRDPAWFRDPADNTEYLLFTASLAASSSAFNGTIGVARRLGSAWQLLPPLITADGVNNELERPHIVISGNYYYLFWSTQASVFAPGIEAPTGLYGMVTDRLAGPWTPINGTGLVIGNPAEAPHQAYSWLVLNDLRVVSFIDRCPNFIGQPAPEFKLQLVGDIVTLAPLASHLVKPQSPRTGTSARLDHG